MGNSHNIGDIEAIFKEFLNIHWLRPEAALMKTYDYSQLKCMRFEPPSLDVTCGDGVSSFIWAGGKFGLGFDMYQSVNAENFFENADVFDHFFLDKFHIDIVKRPTWHFTVGLDKLSSAIEKAKLLDFYEETYVHDCNYALPFPDESFATIFSTTFFAIENQELFLKEVHRVLKKSGRFIARIHDHNFREKLPYNWYLQHGWEWAKILDRGIWHDNAPNDYSLDDWIQKFTDAKLQLVLHKKYLPFIVYRMYTLGFRPLFPAFMEMYDRLSTDDRISVKKIWIDNLFQVLSHFCDPEWMQESYNSPMVSMVELVKT